MSTAPELRTDSTNEQGLFSMLRAGLETSDQRASFPLAVLCALTTLSGFHAISGAHLGGEWKAPVAGVERELIFWVAFATLVTFGAGFRSVGRHRLAGLAWMMAAYLGGNALSGYAHGVVPIDAIEGPAWRFVASRLLYAAAVTLPMFLLLAGCYRDRTSFPLRAGNWRSETRLSKGDAPRSWAHTWLTFLIVAALPTFLLMQVAVGFGPLKSGRLPGLLVPLVLMALANAFAEELMFRGLLHGAAVEAIGPALGVWTIGILFGLHHWGASFAPLASFVGAIAVGAGSVIFGKSALETRGLAWAISAHALINIGVFSAYYVAV